MGCFKEEGQRRSFCEADSYVIGAWACKDLGECVPGRETPWPLVVLKEESGVVSRAHRKGAEQTRLPSESCGLHRGCCWGQGTLGSKHPDLTLPPPWNPCQSSPLAGHTGKSEGKGTYQPWPYWSTSRAPPHPCDPLPRVEGRTEEEGGRWEMKKEDSRCYPEWP